MKRLPARKHTELAIIVVVLAVVVVALGLWTAYRASGGRSPGKSKGTAKSQAAAANVPAAVAHARTLSEQGDARALDAWTAVMNDATLDKAARGEAAYRIGMLRAMPSPPDVAGATAMFKQAVALAPATTWADKAMTALADLCIKADRAQDALEPLNAYRAKAKDPALIKAKLGDVNIAVLFSPFVTEVPKCEYYTVASGDSLVRIAGRTYNGKTTAELLQEANRISDPRQIRPGDRLKVVVDTFRIVVDKSDNTLTLFCGDTFMKEYAVGTGKFSNTPVGKFTIVSKEVDPMWNGIPYGDPRNILGTRWMQFTDEAGTLRGFGIHGTTEPETIGKHSSAGCVRMHNKDVEELYKIVVKGTPVEIVD
ncbi:MAG: L,D-transpeptidase family protein [Verrucomicrobia bacterium]|nr:L,D-transpeptidase family protein [Verrucomicrobiota bacterium]